MSKHIRQIVLALFLTALLATLRPASATTGLAASISEDDRRPMAPDVVLVGLKPGVWLSTSGIGTLSTDSALDTTFADVGVQDIEPVFAAAEQSMGSLSAQEASPLSHIYRLRLSPGSDVLQAVRDLSRNPAVAYAEPDYLAHIIATPNDPQYPDQWGLSQISAPDAWDETTGSSDVVIAVVDSGLDTSHPDLAGRLWTNPGEIAGNGIDDDNNGHLDDMHGWNIVDDDANLSDNTGHGTQVAGVIGAETDNGNGVAGVCWNCRLMVVKVTQSGGVANYSDIAAGVAYAAQKGAEVINLSLGGYADSTTLRTAIQEAAETAVVVGGAGNDDKSDCFYPAAYDNVLAVSGTTGSDAKVGTSNYGTWVDVSAPGETIRTTFDGGGYGDISGTSMAVPFVSGLAGLLKSQHADWAPDLLQAHIVHTTDNIDSANPGYEGQLGSGRINANTAVGTDASPQISVQSHTVDGEDQRPEPGSTFELAVSLRNEWGPASGLAGTLSTSDGYATVDDGSGTFGDIPLGDTGDNRADTFQVTLDTHTPYAHPILFTLDLNDETGFNTSLPLTVTVRSSFEHLPGGTVIGTDTTWTADKTYVLDGNVVVGENVTLTIEPGTSVQGTSGHWLRVDGTLIASGTVASPISFVGHSSLATGTVPFWGGLRFSDKSEPTVLDENGGYVSGSIVRHVHLQHAEAGIGIDGSTILIADSIFESNGVDTIFDADPEDEAAVRIIDNGQALITDCHFTHNRAGVYANNSRLSVTASIFTGSFIAIYADNTSMTLVGNTITNNTGGIYGSGSGSTGIVVRENVIMDNSGGGAGFSGHVTFEHNLVANNGWSGLNIDINSGSVRHNTIINNHRYGILAQGEYTSSLSFGANNLFGNDTYDLYLGTPENIDAGECYWGDMPPDQIPVRIYDCNDKEFGCPDDQVGEVTYQPAATDPITEAPAFVQEIIVAPQMAGIEQVTFDVTFSRPMDQGVPPAISFHTSRRGTSTVFTEDDGLADDRVSVIEADREGNLWFGSFTWDRDSNGVSRYDGQEWTTYSTDSSGLLENTAFEIFVDRDGRIWFGHRDGISRWDGSEWVTYTENNTGEFFYGLIRGIAQTSDGTMWFALQSNGLLRYDGSSWDHLTIDDGLPSNDAHYLTVDQHDHVWIAFGVPPYGVAMYDGTSWTAYDSLGGSVADWVHTVFADSTGRVWVATASDSMDAYISKFEDNEWTSYGYGNTDHQLDCGVRAIAEDDDGVVWFASERGDYFVKYDSGTWSRQETNRSNVTIGTMTFDTHGNLWTNWSDDGGASVLWQGEDFPVVENARWLDDVHYRATYGVTSLVPRGDYDVSVSGARSASAIISGTQTISLPAGDIPIPPETRFGFTVGYAGEISDRTAPKAPSVIAGGREGDPTTVEAAWWADDPDSQITGYRYAIGSAAGATDIVNWTVTSDDSLTRSGLGLVEGQQYWLSVQARNAGGLWSPSGYSAFIAGRPYPRIYLPLVVRNH
jgi:thermitase